jgi:hypothetical protein
MCARCWWCFPIHQSSTERNATAAELTIISLDHIACLDIDGAREGASAHNAVEAEGFVNTQAGHAGVQLGRELVRLGSVVSANLKTLVRPYLQELHQRTKDTVDLTLLMDGTPIVVDQISSTVALLRKPWELLSPPQCDAALKR